MDTHDQFRDSERRTFWLRATAAAVAIGASAAIPGASFSVPFAVVLGVIAATMIGVVKLSLLPRFRSDAWIYGQMGADAALAGAMLAVFGPLSPAIAWPAFGVAYYSLFLGRYGAATAALLGTASVGVAVVFHTETAPLAPIVAAAILGAVATVSSILATDRFNERARRIEVEELVAHEARSSRVLAGLMRMANARGDREVANALSDAVRAACQYPAAVSFVTRPSDGALVPIAWRLDSGEQPIAGQAVELPDSDTPGAIAARQGTALVIDGPAHMPAWARELGYVSGLVLPVTRGMDLLGIVYALRRRPSVTTVSEIEQLELVAAFASRMLSGSGPGSTPSAGMLDSLLARRGHEHAPAQPVIALPGVKLDPAREQAEIEGVSISLSRTEFALLYALASNPGRAFEATVLAQTCWEGDAPNDNAVDVTVYRLRRKLAKAPAGQDLIQTVRGRGYMIQVSSAGPVEVTS